MIKLLIKQFFTQITFHDTIHYTKIETKILKREKALKCKDTIYNWNYKSFVLFILSIKVCSWQGLINSIIILDDIHVMDENMIKIQILKQNIFLYWVNVGEILSNEINKWRRKKPFISIVMELSCFIFSQI